MRVLEHSREGNAVRRDPGFAGLTTKANQRGRDTYSLHGWGSMIDEDAF
jgi:hypothetical protein